MNNTLRANNVGLAVGGFLAFFHLCWSVLVAIGVAQWYMDWIFRLHMIRVPFTVETFSAAMALGLIIVTGVMGYIGGYVFAFFWNLAHKQ